MLRNFLKIGAVSVALLLSSSVWAQIYETDVMATPTTGATSESNKGAFEAAPTWASSYTDCFKTTGSAGYYKLTFDGTGLDLSSYTDPTLVVYWGATSNRPLKVGVNGGTDTQIDAVATSAERSLVREATLSLTETPLTSLNFVSSGGGNVYLMHIVIQDGAPSANDEASADKKDGAWYLFNNGAKLDGEPSTPGLYVHDRAVVLKN